MCFPLQQWWWWGRWGGGTGSQLPQPVVGLQLAALPGPGLALMAELLQVLPEVLVVHGGVGLRLALRLEGRQEEEVNKTHTHRTRKPNELPEEEGGAGPTLKSW